MSARAKRRNKRLGVDVRRKGETARQGGAAGYMTFLGNLRSKVVNRTNPNLPKDPWEGIRK